MTEIDIIFPDPKTSVPGALVQDDPKAMPEGEYVFWNIYNANTSVKKVKIEFVNNPQATFFPLNGNTQTSFVRDLLQGRRIWGKAPGTNVVDRSMEYKYTVTGLDANGKPVPGAFVDPKIYTDKP